MLLAPNRSNGKFVYCSENYIGLVSSAPGEPLNSACHARDLYVMCRIKLSYLDGRRALINSGLIINILSGFPVTQMHNKWRMNTCTGTLKNFILVAFCVDLDCTRSQREVTKIYQYLYVSTMDRYFSVERIAFRPIWHVLEISEKVITREILSECETVHCSYEPCL